LLFRATTGLRSELLTDFTVGCRSSFVPLNVHKTLPSTGPAKDIPRIGLVITPDNITTDIHQREYSLLTSDGTANGTIILTNMFQRASTRIPSTLLFKALTNPKNSDCLVSLLLAYPKPTLVLLFFSSNADSRLASPTS